MKALAPSIRSAFVSASEIALPVRFRRDTAVYEQGTDADQLFLIDSGLVKLTRTRRHGGGAQIMAIVGAHQMLGEDCLSETNRVHNVGAYCVTDVSAYQVSISEVKRLLGIPIVASTLLNLTFDRNRNLIDRAEQREQFDVLRRLLCALAEIARLVEPMGDTYLSRCMVTTVHPDILLAAASKTLANTHSA